MLRDSLPLRPWSAGHSAGVRRRPTRCGVGLWCRALPPADGSVVRPPSCGTRVQASIRRGTCRRSAADRRSGWACRVRCHLTPRHAGRPARRGAGRRIGARGAVGHAARCSAGACHAGGWADRAGARRPARAVRGSPSGVGYVRVTVPSRLGVRQRRSPASTSCQQFGAQAALRRPIAG